jgi:hypothetical protein
VKDLNAIVGELGRQATDETRGAKVDQEFDIAKNERVLFDPVTGDPLGEIADKTKLDTLSQSLPALKNAISAIDRLTRFADEYGGASETVRGKQWQELTGTKAFIIPELSKGFSLGALDQGLVDQADKMLGGADPTSFIRDAAPGLKNARAMLQNKANALLKNAGIKKPWTVPDTSQPLAAAVDDDIDAASGRGGLGAFDPARLKLGAAATTAALGGKSGLSREEFAKSAGLTPEEEERIEEDIDQDQQQGFAGIARRVREGDDAAATGLATMAGNAKLTAKRRQTAAHALMKLGLEGNPTALRVYRDNLDTIQAALLAK